MAQDKNNNEANNINSLTPNLFDNHSSPLQELVLDTDITPVNGKVSKSTQKRNRISYVCQSCRKLKTKCDMLKPQCTHCKEQNLTCIYDFTKQAAPKRPNKDAIIARLSKQVDYWQNRALKQEIVSRCPSNDLHANINSNNSNNSRINIPITNSDFIPSYNTPLRSEANSKSASFVIPNSAPDNNNDTKNNNTKNNNTKNNNTNNNNTNNNNNNTAFLNNQKNIENSDIQNKINYKKEAFKLNPEHIFIDFYQGFPKLVIKNGVKQDLDVFSDLALVKNDIFLLVFMSSIFGFSQKSAIYKAAAPENMPFIPRSQTFLNNFKTISPHIFNGDKFKTPKAQEFFERIITGPSNLSHIHRVHWGLLSFLGNFTFAYLEDFSLTVDDYSEVLKTTLKSINACLPPKHILHIHKKHFYENIYPILAAVEVSMFEECLADVLCDDPKDPQRYILDIGTTNIRYKIENLALLLILLRISYMSMSTTQYVENSDLDYQAILEEHVISANFIEVAFKCLLSLNIFLWTTENMICCLIYLWALLALSPDEGDIFNSKPTDLVINMVATQAFAMGLHREPTEYEQFQKLTPSIDPRLVNYRRKLWISLSTILRIENLVKGKIKINDEDYRYPFNFQDFMNSVLKSNLQLSPLEKRMYTLMYRRLQLIRYISDLFKHCRSKQACSLSSAEQMILKIENFLEKHFSLIDLKKPTSNSHETLYPTNLKLSTTLIENQISMDANLFSKAHTLIINFNIYVVLQKACKDPSICPQYMPYFQKYFIILIHDVCASCKLLKDIFEGTYTYALPRCTGLSLNRAINLLLTRVLFIILSLLIRFSFSKYILTRRLSSRVDIIFNRNEIEERIALLEKISDNTLKLLETLCKYSSNRFRFLYFQSFKTLLFFDFIIKAIKNGEMCHIILRILNKNTQSEKLTPYIIEALRVGLGFNCENSEDYMEALEQSDLLSTAPLYLLEEYDNILNIMGVMENNAKEETCNENYNKTHFTSNPVHSPDVANNEPLYHIPRKNFDVQENQSQPIRNSEIRVPNVNNPKLSQEPQSDSQAFNNSRRRNNSVPSNLRFTNNNKSFNDQQNSKNNSQNQYEHPSPQNFQRADPNFFDIDQLNLFDYDFLFKDI
ncbi:oleate-activated transcription factor OAF1 SCDLUD_003339 [Saccharomycodes ludwigii]|uniref:oleate-activated transcription factor OAF1 n=1 Tax=Saccharomycodes ludwigii TaxID=36035 RepID=UPI001E883D39|nr:hypothetical protein SCDLUD_003339 [Saccharomycodes ludwigii]KAH3900365.1 hypothetical protein SCDLUD_003339 [Saccharomycodes ludwigii]